MAGRPLYFHILLIAFLPISAQGLPAVLLAGPQRNRLRPGEIGYAFHRVNISPRWNITTRFHGARGVNIFGNHRRRKSEGGDRIILSVRPGITGPATLKYRDEEALLAAQHDPERYNDQVLWPDKVRLNREYVENWSFWGDIRLILKTVIKKR